MEVLTIRKVNIILNQKGLTLIELLAVIIIFSIIAAIAIPSISAVINNSRDKAIISDIISMVNTSELSIVDDSCGDDLICTYNNTQNEIGFKSEKFSVGEVDFRDGKSDNAIKIKVNIPSNKFKGRNAEKFADTVADSKVFTKKQLMELLEE